MREPVEDAEALRRADERRRRERFRLPASCQTSAAGAAPSPPDPSYRAPTLQQPPMLVRLGGVLQL